MKTMVTSRTLKHLPKSVLEDLTRTWHLVSCLYQSFQTLYWSVLQPRNTKIFQEKICTRKNLSHLGLGQMSNFSWDEPILSGSYKVVWVSLNRSTRSALFACFRRIERLYIVSGTKTSIFTCDELNWLYENVYLASFGKNLKLRKLLFGLSQSIGSTRPMFNVWPNRRSYFNLGRPKLEFASSHDIV